MPAAACLLRIVVAAWAEATLFLKEGASETAPRKPSLRLAASRPEGDHPRCDVAVLRGAFLGTRAFLKDPRRRAEEEGSLRAH